MNTSITTDEQAYNVINQFVKEIENVINEHKDNDRLEQIKAIIEKHSIVHGWIRLWLDWDYQVNNGGVSQYVDNGYHSTFQKGCMDNTRSEDNIHQELVRLTEDFLKSYPVDLGHTFLSIIKDFKITLDDEEMITECCDTCDGSGTEYEYDEDSEEEISSVCSNCDGTGECDNYNENYNNPDFDTRNLFDKLTKRYYAISDSFIIQVAESLNNKIK